MHGEPPKQTDLNQFWYVSSEVAELINSAKFYDDRWRGIGLAGTGTSRVSIGKQGRP